MKEVGGGKAGEVNKPAKAPCLERRRARSPIVRRRTRFSKCLWRTSAARQTIPWEKAPRRGKRQISRDARRASSSPFARALPLCTFLHDGYALWVCSGSLLNPPLCRVHLCTTNKEGVLLRITLCEIIRWGNRYFGRQIVSDCDFSDFLAFSAHYTMHARFDLYSRKRFLVCSRRT